MPRRVVRSEVTRMDNTRIRVLLVDDHVLIRIGLRRVLEDSGSVDVIGEASSGEQAMDLVRALPPDIVLMDINMPGIGGIEATRRLLAQQPDLRIIILTVSDDDPLPTHLFELGAAGYLTKDCSGDELLRALRAVTAGGRYITPRLASRLMAAPHRTRTADSVRDLSKREYQIMTLLAQGRTVREISDSLCLSPKTVFTYRYRLFEKLGVDNDVALTRLVLFREQLEH